LRRRPERQSYRHRGRSPEIAARRLCRIDWGGGLGKGQGARKVVARPCRSGGLRKGEEPLRLRIGFQRPRSALLQEAWLSGDRPHAEFSDPWQCRNPAAQDQRPSEGSVKVAVSCILLLPFPFELFP